MMKTDPPATGTGAFSKAKAPSVFAFEKKVETTVSQYKMISGNDTVLVALSGGADSVSLLFSLYSLSQKIGFSLAACHLNHGIRENTACRDENFSACLADKLGIPFYSEKKDIPAICRSEKDSGSVETAARRERYSFFERTAEKAKATKIATAHTMSDNAETVLFNLCRGSSPDGLCGIPPTRDNYIRPLIMHSRAEIEEYLFCLGQEYVTDETNFDEEYSRNFLRRSVIPKLKTLNPGLEEAFFRFSEAQRQDKNYFQKKISEHRFDENLLPLSLISESEEALRRRYIRELCKNAAGDGVFIGCEHISAISAAAAKTANDLKTRYVSLPKNLTAVINFRQIEIKTGFEEPKTETQICGSSFNIPIKFGQNIINETYAVFAAAEIPEKAIRLPDVITNEEIVYKLYKKAECFSDIMYNNIFVRNRQQGDFIRIGGMSRKLKKVFCEFKVPADERNEVPVVCDGNGNIICVPFFSAPSDDAKAAEPQKSKTIIAFYKAIQ